MLSSHINSGYVVTWLGVFLRVLHTYPWWMKTTDAKLLMVRGAYSEYFLGRKNFNLVGGMP